MGDKLINNFIKYVSLNILGMIALSCYILADTYLIANGIGSKGLTSLNFAISIYSFINGTGLMLGIGGATKYNIQKSCKREEEGNETFTTTVKLGLFIGFIYFCLGVFVAKSLSILLGASGEILIMTETYLKTILYFSPCFILNNIMIAFIRNDGSPKTAMAGMIVGSLSNVLLDYIFIFHFDMGMFGAAFATGLAPIISMVFMLPYFIKKQNNFHFIKSKIKINISLYLNIITLGVSSFVSEIASGITLIVFNLLFLNLSGNTAVAAYGIVANLALIAIGIFTGIGQGIQPLVSYYYGVNKLEKVHKIFKYAELLSFTLAIILYLIIWIFGDSIVSLFNSGSDIILKSIAENGLSIYFIGFLFAGINVVMSAYFSAIEKAKTGFLLAVLRGIIVIVPLSIILSLLWGVNGIWLTFPITEALVFVVGIIEKNKVLKCTRDCEI